MSLFGLQPTGFIRKLYAQSLADVQSDFKGVWGAGINLEPESNFGQMAAIMANRLDEAWQVGQAVYTAFTTDGTDGVAQDNLNGLTGTIRLPATFTKVTAFLIGTNGTAVASGKTAAVAVAGTQLTTQAAVTIVTVPAWSSTTFVWGDIVSRSGNLYVCIVGGAAGSGPSGTGAVITDGAVTWSYIGTGSAAVKVLCKAVSTGPSPVNVGTLTSIQTPVSGWSAVTNVANDPAYIVGTLLESGSAYRIRRENELRATGNAAVDAVRAKVLEVTGVTSCNIFNNDSDITDVNGVPPHSLECLVQGGDNADVAAAIFASISAGIQPYGGTIVSVTDSQGFAQPTGFTRPTLVPIYITANVKKGANWNNSTSAATIKSALVAWGALNLVTGGTVVDTQLYVPIFEAVTGGVSDILSLYIGTAPGPATSTNIPVASRSLAEFLTANIVVNAT